MQINAQSALKSPLLVKDKMQVPSSVSAPANTADKVTLSPAALALAKGETVEPDMTIAAVWPTWPTKPSKPSGGQSV